VQSFRSNFGKVQQQADVLIGLIEGESVFLIQAVESFHKGEDFLCRDKDCLGLVLLVIGDFPDNQRLGVIKEGRCYFLPLIKLCRQTCLIRCALTVHFSELVIKRQEQTQQIGRERCLKLIVADIRLVLEQRTACAKTIGSFE